MPVTRGIHHVSMISGDPQRNLDFYSGVLGLRLIKKTVNFDDPFTYHLYYGDETGRPGSLLTFFPWGRDASPGRIGLGQVSVTSLSILPRAVGYWISRLITAGVRYQGPATRFGEQVLEFRDPDGNQLELVGHDSAESSPGWPGGPVPEESRIRGVHGVTLLVDDAEPTVSVLSKVLGYAREDSAESRVRMRVAGDIGTIVDVRGSGGFWSGAQGAGTVHHVAFRAADAEQHAATREAVLGSGLAVTPVRERFYFQSIYFREPGGVLFESATDGPGFGVDEPPDQLGDSLRLPPWLEQSRPAIEARLSPLEVPGTPRYS